MKTTEIEIEIDVVCDECGADLEATWCVKKLHVKPCDDCGDKAFEQGIEEAKKAAEEDAT